ncbi:uncharacterized protein LOC132282932 [Cornus florida]|uniref:uncharacterized protein LOC132282932 n=1 Tax=Cornus florida TaxID=4283 RepID=UPI0028A13714|nr:uncharacterized protein LOC132282932 [Cornus florida]
MACGGLRVHWCNSGVQVNSEEQHGLAKEKGVVISNNKLFFKDPKLWQQKKKQKSQFAHCSLRLVNNHQLEAYNPTQNPSLLGDSIGLHWREMNNVHKNTRIVEDDEDDRISQKLDHWIRDCVTEIVSNIGKAPLLVHIYSDDEKASSSSSTSIKITIEKAVARGLWEAESPIPTPNGVILVEELNSSEEGGAICDEKKSNGVGISSQQHKLWGILIQGKGVNRIGHACYILKTCRVQSLFGFCTHFCLTRVECFVESAEIQLQKMWLQR